MSISHNSYHGGRLQSLGFVTVDGKPATVGIALPGEYDFGPADRKETVTVTSGAIIPIGRSDTTAERTKTGLIFMEGTPISFRCNEPTTFICVYE